MTEKPTFMRWVYDENMRRVFKPVPHCDCREPMKKTKAAASTCANCGGAVLTAKEVAYLKSIGFTSRKVRKAAAK